MQFWRSRRETSDKAQEIFSSMSELDRMTFLSKNLLFIKWFLCTWKCRFDNPAETFSTNGRKFCAQCPKILRNVSALSKNNIFFIRMYLWKTWIKFWQPRWKNFEIRPKNCNSMSDIDEKSYNLPQNSFFHLKKIQWTGDIQFWRPANLFPTRGWRFFAQSPKVLDQKSKEFLARCLKIVLFCFFFLQKTSFFHQDVFMFN